MEDFKDRKGEKALAWVAQENTRTMGVLKSGPRYERYRKDAETILTSDARLPLGKIHGIHYYNYWQDAEHPRGFLRRASVKSLLKGDPKWETVLDVDALAQAEGQPWIFQERSLMVEPSGQRCMIALSRGGQDAAEFREFDLTTNTFVTGGFFLPEAKTYMEWADRDTLLVITDWGPDSLTNSGYGRIAKLWERGTPLSDATTVYEGEVTDNAVFPAVFRNPSRTEIVIGRGVNFFHYEIFLVQDGKAVPTPLIGNMTPEGLLGNQLIMKLEEEWSYQDQRFPAGSVVAFHLDTQEAMLIFLPTHDRMSVRSVHVTADGVLLNVFDNMVSRLMAFEPNRKNWKEKMVESPPQGVITIQDWSGFRKGVLLTFENMATPSSLMWLTGRRRLSAVISMPAFFSSDDLVVEQRFATSNDGTQVSYFLLAKRSVLSAGPAPTLLNGYGGFNVSRPPVYDALMGKLLVENGGVFALGQIRGGGDYGPGWWEAAKKHNRPRAFEDFAAIAKHLIDTGVTTAKQLGIKGRSNGGLLVCVSMINHPELFGAVIAEVPLTDMINYTDPAFNVGNSWKAEYGDPGKAEDLAVLTAYSPLQRVSASGIYPPLFVVASTGDDRVHPYHARAMAYTMAQHDHSVLYYEDMEGGHGAAVTPQQKAVLNALQMVFLWDTLAPTSP